MSEIYFTSDLHFNHDKDFIYKPRGYHDVKEASESILKNINDLVKEDDTLYILGDIMLNDNEVGIKYFNQIKCNNIHIILGNHDRETRIALYKQNSKVKEMLYATMLKHGQWTFFLSHFPSLTGNYNASKKGEIIFNICGHIHTKDKYLHMKQGLCCYHVEVDCHDNKPINIKDIEKDISSFMEENKEINFSL